MKTVAVVGQAPSTPSLPEPIAGAVGGGVTVIVLWMLYFIIKEVATYLKNKELSEEQTMKEVLTASNTNKSKILDTVLQQQQEMLTDNLEQNKTVLKNIQDNQLKLTETQHSLIDLLGVIGTNSANNSAEIKALLQKIDEFTEREMNRFLQAQTGIQVDVIRKYTILEKSVEAIHIRLDNLIGRSNMKPVVLQPPRPDELL